MVRKGRRWYVCLFFFLFFCFLLFFFFQAEDGIRDDLVTGVQTCALPIYQDYQDFQYNQENLVFQQHLANQEHPDKHDHKCNLEHQDNQVRIRKTRRTGRARHP